MSDLSADRRCSRMAKCDYCGKGVTFGIKVSHSHRRSNRTWKPNVKRVKAVVNGTPCHVYACTRCLRSTLLERRHLVQAYTWHGVPFTIALTRFTLGFQVRLERLWEWETLIPKVTPLPQKSHFAIRCTSYRDDGSSKLRPHKAL